MSKIAKQPKRKPYNYAFLDEASKKEIRRKTLKAVAIPGYQVPFASRELPIGRGWGTGGLQLTLSLLGDEDFVKVIDQGSDDSVNAVSIRKLINDTTNAGTATDTTKATIIQSRHRIPEEPLNNNQVLILQVPKPEPLRKVEPREEVTKRQHAEKDYTAMWLEVYEDIVRWGNSVYGADYPVLVNNRYVMAPSPIPRWDNPKLHQSSFLTLLGAGREKRYMLSRLIRMLSRYNSRIILLKLKGLRGRNVNTVAAHILFLKKQWIKKQTRSSTSAQILLIVESEEVNQEGK